MDATKDPLRRMRARRAALILHSKGLTNTGPARAALATRWERDVDPDLILDPAERARRAGFARHAFYEGLAIKSAEARRSRSARKVKAAAGARTKTAAPSPAPGAAIREVINGAVPTALPHD